jgi:hypothetical protein
MMGKRMPACSITNTCSRGGTYTLDRFRQLFPVFGFNAHCRRCHTRKFLKDKKGFKNGRAIKMAEVIALLGFHQEAMVTLFK